MTDIVPRLEGIPTVLKQFENSLILIREDTLWRQMYTSQQVRDFELELERVWDEFVLVRKRTSFLVVKYASSTIGSDTNLIEDLALVRAQIEQFEPKLALLVSKTTALSGATL